MRRLVAAGLLPERAGQPVKAWVHISLADLMVLDGSSALLEEWTARVRAQWAGHRAAASAGGGDGGAWLDGDAAEAVACDAAMAPFVTGEVNPGKPAVVLTSPWPESVYAYRSRSSTAVTTASSRSPTRSSSTSGCRPAAW